MVPWIPYPQKAEGGFLMFFFARGSRSRAGAFDFFLRVAEV